MKYSSLIELLPIDIIQSIYIIYYKNVLNELLYNHNKNNFNIVINSIKNLEENIYNSYCLNIGDFYNNDIIIYKFINDFKNVKNI